MATNTLLSRNSSSYKRLLHHSLNTTKLQTTPFHVRSLASDAKPVSVFDKMNEGDEKKYYMLGGQGGVAKTSYAASLAVKFANLGHSTILFSTDPAHSLSHSFDQDVTGGGKIIHEGLNAPIWAIERNLEKVLEDRVGISQDLSDYMDSMGVGTIGKQYVQRKLPEHFAKRPPGLEEALAISKIMEVAESPENVTFTRIVFDIAPKVHKLELLSSYSLLDNIDPLKSYLMTNDKMRQSLRRFAKDLQVLFSDSAEFIIVTNPTVTAVEESSQLHASLKNLNVTVRRLLVNQITPSSSTDCKFGSVNRKALDMIRKDPGLGNLDLIEALVVDVTMKGIPALKLIGDMVWK